VVFTGAGDIGREDVYMGIEIELRSGRTWRQVTMDPSRPCEWFLGSEGDVIIPGETVLPKHARLFTAESGLRVEPVGQAPVCINGKPISGPMAVGDGDWLALGPAMVQVKFKGATDDGKTSRAPGRAHPGTQAIRIGRLPDCNLCIPSPLVSRNHARMLFSDGRLVIEDLNSTNGTFVNGRRLFAPLGLKPKDKVEIAGFAFIFTGESLEPLDSSGLVCLEADNLTAEVKDRSTGKSRKLLDKINLVVEPGEFVVIFGSSGSGKSTLLDALNGRRPASSGQVLFNGANLYSSFDLFRTSIGYVPQQDIVHRKICVQNALNYTARLRLPPDTSGEEIRLHIDRVLKQVGLSDKALSPIDTPSPLSGGQLKRVSLAVELIANPNILFLDEVTSGLDAGTDKKMMQLFSELASDRKTVICVTHSLENVDVCKLVLLLHRGKLVFFGPPGGALSYFEVNRLSDVYDLIESRPVEFWEDKFAESPFYETFIEKRKASPQKSRKDVRATLREVAGSKATAGRLPQLITLMRRYVDLLLADRRNLAILLLQAPLIATLIGLVFNTSGKGQTPTGNNIAFMLVLSAIWCGCMNSTREVVKELPIYLRERAINLGLGPYLFSKLIPLALLCLLQCFTMLLVVTLLTTWPGSFASRLLALFLAGMAATTMGLAVSTFVDSNDKAAALVPIMLIPQVILANVIVKLGPAGKMLARATIISFCAFDAMLGAQTGSMATLMPGERAFAVDLCIMAALGLAFLLAAFLGLKIKDKKNR
jgi:ABC-type multidrug transport system ATPase subunit